MKASCGAGRPPRKVYCEHGGLSPKLKGDPRVELVHFPYDENATSKYISPTAAPSDAQWRDLNVKDWPGLAHVETWDDFDGSERLPEIRKIVGQRRDALHVDSAYKTGCRAFVTRDEDDILDHREELEVLLGIRFFHRDKDAAALEAFIEEAGKS